jgi:hypothetical protein
MESDRIKALRPEPYLTARIGAGRLDGRGNYYDPYSRIYIFETLELVPRYLSA